MDGGIQDSPFLAWNESQRDFNTKQSIVNVSNISETPNGHPHLPQVSVQFHRHSAKWSNNREKTRVQISISDIKHLIKRRFRKRMSFLPLSR